MRIKHIEKMIDDMLRNAPKPPKQDPTDFGSWSLTGYPESVRQPNVRLSDSSDRRQVR